MTHTDLSRAEFEKWARGESPSINLTREGNGYRYSLAETLYDAWHASRAAIQQSSGVELPEPFAWADDGSTRAGSHATEVRVVTAKTKSGMPRAASEAYTTGLYTEQQVRALLAGAHESRREAQRQLETIQGELAKLERYQFMLNRGALVPPGFKSVPVEPTEEMFLDGMEASCVARPSVDDDSYVRSIWNAMLAAAPQPPKEQT